VVDQPDALSAEGIDVVIDFSTANMTESVARWCAKNRCALVNGVTGLSPRQKTSFIHTADQAPVLWSPNMSLGIAVLKRMLLEMKALSGFDFFIEETHHKNKVDSPSGTAVDLHAHLEQTLKTSVPQPVAIRGGGVFGIHRVGALGGEETLVIEHSALNRRVFARGALQAANWLRQQPPGLYEMADVIASLAFSGRQS